MSSPQYFIPESSVDRDGSELGRSGIEGRKMNGRIVEGFSMNSGILE
jgi:hypothetical protein